MSILEHDAKAGGAQSDTSPLRAERTIQIVRVCCHGHQLARLESCAPGAVCGYAQGVGSSPQNRGLAKDIE